MSDSVYRFEAISFDEHRQFPELMMMQTRSFDLAYPDQKTGLAVRGVSQIMHIVLMKRIDGAHHPPSSLRAPKNLFLKW
jgi:hypothetical protein